MTIAEDNVAEPQSDRPLRLRKAILMLAAHDEEARAVTKEDIAVVWPLLGDAGLLAFDVRQLANGPDIRPDLFERLMKSMNSYL